MQYDPIKRRLGKVFNQTPFLRIVFYKLLNLLLLRAWHINRELRRWYRETGEKARILDAGAGFGQYTFYMARLGEFYDIQSIDLKEEQVNDCNRFFRSINLAHKVDFVQGDLTSFVAPEQFDLVLCVDVMEHIEQDELVFSNFHKSLKQGGMLLISTPSDLGGSDVHDHDQEASFIDEHVRDGYNMTDMEKKLLGAGFSKVECRYSYGKPGHISWVLSMKVPLKALNISKLFFILLPIYYLTVFPWCLLLNQIDLSRNHATGTGLIVKAWK